MNFQIPTKFGRFTQRAALVSTICIGTVFAQVYPNRPIQLIVGSSAGGGGDTAARLVAQPLGELLGQTIVIENKPGAGGNIGADMVAKAAPDGYTLLWAYTGHVINPGLYAKLPFDTVRDFSPVAIVATNQTMLVVRPGLPVNNVQELIALARREPGKYTMGTLTGSSQHLAGELFKSLAKIDILFVPYKGAGQALNASLAGEIDVMFNTVAVLQPHIKAGKLRALAVAGKTRSPVVPDVPTISESGLPGFSSIGWYGVVAPANTPADVVAKLSDAITKIMARPEIKSRMLSMGNEPVAMSTAAFDSFIREEIPRWAKVIKDAKIPTE